MNASPQLASAMLVLLFAAGMLMVGQSYTDGLTKNTFVIPASLLLQAR